MCFSCHKLFLFKKKEGRRKKEEGRTGKVNLDEKLSPHIYKPQLKRRNKERPNNWKSGFGRKVIAPHLQTPIEWISYL
ncbi:MAG: hypothetical protein F6K48_22670 [Okeania sp. SIO3H1]|nr:hypothetical protein [Okeania sp. SIO3H1]